MPPNDRSLIMLLAGVLAAGHVGPAHADRDVLDLYVGRWNMQVRTLQPAPKEVTFVESYRWVLDGKYIQGETTGKADGTTDLMFGTFEQGKGYHFWVFSSSGSYLYLPPASWDPARRVMNWKSPPGWDVSYTGYCQFPDRARRMCAFQIKDWKGKVILEQQTTAVRRSD